MEQSRAGGAAGEDEGAERLELVVVEVTRSLECVDVGLLDAQGRVFGVLPDGGAQVGADVEEVVLDPRQEGHDVVREPAEGDRDTEGGVGLVGLRVGV